MSDETGATTSADAGNTHFTAGEIKFLLAALQHAEGGSLKFDYDAVATQLGLKDGKTARARWNTIARTKINSAARAGSVEKASPASKKKATPKKAAGEDAEKATPKKRGRKEKREESAAVKVEEKDEEDDEA